MPSSRQARQEIAVAIGVLLLALGLGVGARTIPSDAGYAGVGPDFLPWVVSLALLIAGSMLLWEARTGGFRDVEGSDDGAAPYWPGFVWMSAGLLANAMLITSIGFILSCALCFVMAARGARLAQGQVLAGARAWLIDGCIGLLIAAPVYWMFTQFLAINLPGLTQSGWL